ncbi:Uncharacterised protein g5180 [Pycnogonum litorale]
MRSAIPFIAAILILSAYTPAYQSRTLDSLLAFKSNVELVCGHPVYPGTRCQYYVRPRRNDPLPDCKRVCQDGAPPVECDCSLFPIGGG